jgi:RNA polymerase sigma-70 factor (ECF subfamily)
VARFFVGLASKAPADMQVRLAEVNGEPAALARIGGRVTHVFVPEVADGKVLAVRAVASPLKLAYLHHQLALQAQ